MMSSHLHPNIGLQQQKREHCSDGDFRSQPFMGFIFRKKRREGDDLARALLANTDACTALRRHTHIHPSIHPLRCRRVVLQLCMGWLVDSEIRERDRCCTFRSRPASCLRRRRYLFLFSSHSTTLLFHDSNTGFSYLIILSERASDLSHIHLHSCFFASSIHVSNALMRRMWCLEERGEIDGRKERQLVCMLDDDVVTV